MHESPGSEGLHDRIAELEERLRQIERDRAGGRTGAWMRRFMPAEASNHFRAAGREQLLGMRALVDHWIRRLDEQPAGRSDREEIPIE